MAISASRSKNDYLLILLQLMSLQYMYKVSLLKVLRYETKLLIQFCHSHLECLVSLLGVANLPEVKVFFQELSKNQLLGKQRFKVLRHSG